MVYRIVIKQTGLDQFGIWSLLLAGSAFARIGDISGAGALSRFVAMRALRGDDMWARDTVHTVLITSIVFNAALSVLLWFIAPFVLGKYVDPAFQAEANRLVPFAIANMFLGALAMAVTSGIDGAQRADQRALVMIAAAMFLLLASFVLVPGFGILGFAIAQVAYQCLIVVTGWVVLRSHIAGLGWLPWHWRRGIFAETTGYALRLNAIGIMTLLFEPITKFAFNAIGGLSLVALYELASRLVVRTRDLAVAAAMPLVPAFAAHSTVNNDESRKIMLKVTRLAAMAAVVNTVIILAVSPLLSIIMLGRISHDFLVIAAALAVGWNLGLPILAFYFAAQGQGILLWNFLTHATLSGSVVFGVYVLAPAFGMNGLLIAIAVGFALSTIPSIIGNARALHVMDIAKQSFLWIAASGLTIIMLTTGVFLLTEAFSL